MLQCIWVAIFFSFILVGELWVNMKRKENSFQAIAMDLMLRTFVNA